ncbi:enoyl-CoA hydratase/isomerase family protein [Subtercola frigoramans]|uniref:Enoyl-CoA hydratase n=1 Tax=Subtercola frigoramans TaxID=120298 RepID=A0ABS2L1I1_9MICO|nr:enoyl-CoA hydratase/isomerase family protein [Subtercola frigoramans]MBM7470884.1 enoyl-CoA hydratase [Subtercola frigoramans]
MTSIQIDEAEDRVFARIVRPETRNAIDREMVEELHALCASLESEPRVLILSGTDTERNAVFASGADIRELRYRRRDQALSGINSSLFDRIAKLPLPVIAAVDGFALGGGAELAMAADFRIATPRARFGNPETGLGIMAAAGATWRLRELVGIAVATEILLAGRILDAREALALRLITEIHEPEDLLNAASRLADRIVAQDPLAVRITKMVMHMPRSSHPYVDDLAQAVLFEADGKEQRMTAFLNRKGTER